MTPSHLDVPGYSNQYMDSSPSTHFTTIELSPPDSVLQNVLVNNELMYPSTINPNQLFPIKKDNKTTNYVNGPIVRNAGQDSLRSSAFRVQPASATISNENTYPDLNNVDYDMPRQIMEGYIPRKGSLPLTTNYKVLNMFCTIVRHLTFYSDRLIYASKFANLLIRI